MTYTRKQVVTTISVVVSRELLAWKLRNSLSETASDGIGVIQG